MSNMKKLDVFINEIKDIYGEKYDCSFIEYKGDLKKVKLICDEHGEFQQYPTHLLRGHGCQKCSNMYRMTEEEFIKTASEVHNNKFIYPKGSYKNKKTRMKIICPDHGDFYQFPKHHLKGAVGCNECRKITTKNFIDRVNKIHDFLYDYSKTEYITRMDYVIITCKKYGHGDFKQTAHNHILGRGCPTCNNSQKEIIITKTLTDNNIVFEPQKRFKECINMKTLPFDFYLTEYNVCIEFDGIQHDEPVKWFGGEEKFKKLKIRDQIKTNFCLENDIKLYRINHKDDIEEKLKWILTQIKN